MLYRKKIQRTRQKGEKMKELRKEEARQLLSTPLKVGTTITKYTISRVRKNPGKSPWRNHVERIKQADLKDVLSERAFQNLSAAYYLLTPRYKFNNPRATKWRGLQPSGKTKCYISVESTPNGKKIRYFLYEKANDIPA